MTTIIFTKQGRLDLIKELDTLINTRVSAVQELKTYREMGDLSENSAYRAARMKLNRIDNRIKRLNFMIDHALIKEPKSENFADIGMIIALKDETKRACRYEIVGTYESNIMSNKISYLSPLGKSIMGKRTGDSVEVVTPSGLKKYTIIAISRA